MKPKTIEGVTRPCPSQQDCRLLDKMIDFLLEYERWESNHEAADAARQVLLSIRIVSERCQALRARAKGGPLPGQKAMPDSGVEDTPTLAESKAKTA